MSETKKFVDFLGADFIKGIKEKFSAFKKEGKKETQKFDTQVKTQDGGKTISVMGDALASGVQVMDVTSGTPAPLADGTYILQDGSTIVVAGGIVTTYTPMAQPDTATVMDAAKMTQQFSAQRVQLEQMFSAKFKAQEAKIEELEKTCADLLEVNKSFMEFVEKVSETPVYEKPKEKEKLFFAKDSLTESEFKKLTPAQQLKYNRGELEM